MSNEIEKVTYPQEVQAWLDSDEEVTGELVPDPTPLWEEWTEPAMGAHHFNVTVPFSLYASMPDETKTALQTGIRLIKEALRP